MKNQIKYTDEPIGKIKVIADFLPSPDEAKRLGIRSPVNLTSQRSVKRGVM